MNVCVLLVTHITQCYFGFHHCYSTQVVVVSNVGIKIFINKCQTGFVEWEVQIYMQALSIRFYPTGEKQTSVFWDLLFGQQGGSVRRGHYYFDLTVQIEAHTLHQSVLEPDLWPACEGETQLGL